MACITMTPARFEVDEEASETTATADALGKTPVAIVPPVPGPELDTADAVLAACKGVMSAMVNSPRPECCVSCADELGPGLSSPYAHIRPVAFDVESELDGSEKEMLEEVALEYDWAASRLAARGVLDTTVRPISGLEHPLLTREIHASRGGPYLAVHCGCWPAAGSE